MLARSAKAQESVLEGVWKALVMHQLLYYIYQQGAYVEKLQIHEFHFLAGTAVKNKWKCHVGLYASRVTTTFLVHVLVQSPEMV